MEILISCSHCSKRLHVSEELAGKHAKCPACGKVIQIPVQQVTPPTKRSHAVSSSTSIKNESADDVMSWLGEGEQSKGSDFAWSSDRESERALTESAPDPTEASSTKRYDDFQTESNNREDRNAALEAMGRMAGSRNKTIALTVAAIVIGVFVVGLAMVLTAAKERSEMATEKETTRARLDEKQKELDDYSNELEQLKEELERQKADHDSKRRELITSFDLKESTLAEREKGLQSLEKSLTAREKSVVERERVVAKRENDLRVAEIAAARDAARREEVEKRNAEQATKILADLAEKESDRLGEEARERLERYLLQLNVQDRPKSIQAMLMLGGVQWAWRNNKYDDPDVANSVKVTLSNPSAVRIVEDIVRIGGDIRFSRKNPATGKDEHITMKETYSLALKILRSEARK